MKNLLKDWRGDVVCLQETKLASVDGSIVHSLWGNPYVGWITLDAIGSVGRVLLMWDKRMVMKQDLHVGRFSVSTLLSNVKDGFQI
jgi:hypothetical protein